MPMISYKCEHNHITKKLYTGGTKIESVVDCKECGAPGKRQLSAPNSHSTFTISQGLTKDVEVSHSIIKAEESKIHKGYAADDEKLRKPY